MTSALKLGLFELHPVSRQVLGDGQALALGARAFDVLAALAERCDRVVSKNELLDVVWPGQAVEENNLTVQISALRKALSADAIVTVTGRGYRLALPVSPLAEHSRPALRPQVALERQLLAIVVADVVGWQRWVARDLDAAVADWHRARSEILEPSLRQFSGRVVELTPEHIQVAFGSAVQAVSWALTLLTALAGSSGHSSGTRVRMRMGICVDDVVNDDGKLVGDGVHMAAEIQQMASHDEVLVTQEVRDLVLRKVPTRFDPLGERFLQRLRRSATLFRLLPTRPGEAVRLPSAPAAARLASVAVWPLTDEGPANEGGYFGAGLGQELTASLSRNRALMVIAHSSMTRLDARDADQQQVAAELGVRYLVTGTVRRGAGHVRVAVNLIQVANNQLIWQGRHDVPDAELFDLQERLAQEIAAAMAPQVQAAEIERVRSRQTDVLDAYELVLRALPGMYRFNTPEFEACGGLLQQAVALDPEYARAHAHLAWWYSLLAAERQAPDAEDSKQAALDHALTAMRLDPQDADALAVAGHLITLLRKQHEQALELFDQALAINPSSVWAWARSATTLAYMGRSEEAMARIAQARRLSPYDAHMFSFNTTCGTACLAASQAHEAVGWLGKALRLNPGFQAARRLLVAALVLANEVSEARAVAAELMAADPEFSVGHFGRWYPMQQPHLGRLLGAMRQAGLPA